MPAKMPANQLFITDGGLVRDTGVDERSGENERQLEWKRLWDENR